MSYPVESDISCRSLAARMGREPTLDERINDVMNNKAIDAVLRGDMPSVDFQISDELREQWREALDEEDG